MANIIYRTSDSATIPVETVVKNSPLTNLEIDGNFRSIKEDIASKAPANNAALTGTPTAPTAPANTSSPQIATTQFVIGQAGTSAPKVQGTATVGVATRFSREDHVHPNVTLNSLSNVTISSPVAGELLSWDGANWVNTNGTKPVELIALVGAAPGWNYSWSGGTAEKPTYMLWSKGTERVRITCTWGTIGGEADNLKVAVFMYSSNSGTSYSTMGTETLTYDANSNLTSTTWS